MPLAYVLINVKPSKEKELLEGLRKLDGIIDARIVMGEFDILVTLERTTMKELNKIITSELRYLDNVESTQTLMAV